MGFDRITIINVQPPERADINSELQWLGAALGLFGDRDKDSSCFRVFVTLVRSGTGMSSDTIAAQTDLSRGTVVHHLNKLRDAGLVQNVNEGYGLNGRSLHAAISQLESEVSETLKLFRAVADDIENRLG